MEVNIQADEPGDVHLELERPSKPLLKRLPWFNIILLMLLFSLFTQLYLDYNSYWVLAPLPFHIFLAVHASLLCLQLYLVRAQTKHIAMPKCFAITQTCCVLLLITSTVQGVKWLRLINAHEINSEQP